MKHSILSVILTLLIGVIRSDLNQVEKIKNGASDNYFYEGSIIYYNKYVTQTKTIILVQSTPVYVPVPTPIYFPVTNSSPMTAPTGQPNNSIGMANGVIPAPSMQNNPVLAPNMQNNNFMAASGAPAPNIQNNFMPTPNMQNNNFVSPGAVAN